MSIWTFWEQVYVYFCSQFFFFFAILAQGLKLNIKAHILKK